MTNPRFLAAAPLIAILGGCHWAPGQVARTQIALRPTTAIATATAAEADTGSLEVAFALQEPGRKVQTLAPSVSKVAIVIRSASLKSPITKSIPRAEFVNGVAKMSVLKIPAGYATVEAAIIGVAPNGREVVLKQGKKDVEIKRGKVEPAPIVLQPPAPPSKPSFEKAGRETGLPGGAGWNRVLLRWAGVADASYDLHYTEWVGSSWLPVQHRTVEANEERFSSLVPGRLYAYALNSRTAVGSSPWSDWAYVTIPNPVYRFVDRRSGPGTDSRCYGNSTSAPAPCPGYTLEFAQPVFALSALCQDNPQYLIALDKAQDHILLRWPDEKSDVYTLLNTGYQYRWLDGVAASTPTGENTQPLHRISRQNQWQGGTYGVHLFGIIEAEIRQAIGSWSDEGIRAYVAAP